MKNLCGEIKLRAERRAGEILGEMEKNKGTLFRGRTMEPRDESLKLTDLDINKTQSSRWQLMAELPEEVFDFWSSPGVKKYFTECREELDSISGVTYLRTVKFANPPHSFRR